ncbi:MAG: ATP-binding protein [Spirochaetota bacterium]
MSSTIQYQNFFNLYTDPSVILSLPTLQILEANEMFLQITNYKREDIQSKSILALILEKDQEKLLQEIHSLTGEIVKTRVKAKVLPAKGLSIRGLWTIYIDRPQNIIYASYQIEQEGIRTMYSERLRALNKIASRKNDNLDENMQELLTLGTQLLNLDLGIISEIEGESYTVLHFYPQDSGLVKGQIFPFQNTYCNITYTHNSVIAIDSMKNSEFAQHPCYENFGLEAYIGVPLEINGKRFGTINFSSQKQNPSLFNAYDYEFIKALGEWVSLAFEKKYEKESLILAKEEAEISSRAKSDFLATMSHEIRTPMNGVIGMTSLLSETELNSEQKEYVDIIRNSGENLLTIINDILDYSKIDSNNFKLEEQPFKLSLCIEDTIDIFIPKASEKNLELLYNINANVPSWIVSDITRLRQILVNLVGNAIKFTEKGEILLEVKVQESINNKYTLLFQVHDTGIGISQDRFTALFEKFTQADASITRKYGGTGLGLAISKKLAGLLGGDLQVESELGKGSIFSFTIQADFSSPPESEKEEEESYNILKEQKVLLVASNKKNLQTLSLQFEIKKIHTYTAETLEIALKKIKKQEFSALILDTQSFTDIDSFLLTVRKELDKEKLPIVLINSYLHKQENKRTYPYNYHLHKPIKLNLLFTTLVNIFQYKDEAITTQSKAEPFGENQTDLRKSYPFQILIAEDNLVNQQIARRFFHK